MIAGAGWQDLVAVLTALVAGAWLFRRWRHKKRMRAGCDACAAAVHSRMARRPAKSGPEVSPR